MKNKFIPMTLICVAASLARADFNPLALTPGSYTYAIVVPSNTVQALPYCINATTGGGTAETDTSVYEQGFYAPLDLPGGNSGVPIHNTTFVASNNLDITFLMPPTYLTNDVLMIDDTFTSGTFYFSTATAATNLAILLTGGGGATTINYTTTHTDSTVDSGTLSMPDWFGGGSTVAWGCNGRTTPGGGEENFDTITQNNDQPPYLYCDNITVSGVSPITSISFTFSSGNHANLFAVSGNASGPNWTPIPVQGFNVIATVPAAFPFPVTATMDNGTNLTYTGIGNTWFEQGYDQGDTSYGLPPSGSTFNSYSQPTHHYMMASYASNNAILIDTNHLSADITPAAPAPYSAFAFLTAGGNIGTGNKMTNMCILQHADGTSETNIFYGYDWFEQTVPGAVAWEANGRVYMNDRSLNTLGNQGLPYLFETYFTLNDTASAVTNIVVKNISVPGYSATTFIMAVSATSGGVPPVITQDPLPTTQTWYPSQTATFAVQVSGTAPITNIWLVESNGIYVPLTDGVDANGSIVSGSSTTTLTISDLTLADSTNYEFEATNAEGGEISTPATLVVNPGTPNVPIIDSQTPPGPAVAVFANETTMFSVEIDASSAPPLSYQWYSGVPQGPATAIAGATNATYVNSNNTAGAYSVIISNFVGTATSSPVALNFITPSSYQSALLAYHPVAYWPLNETSGTIAYDYAGGHDGTYIGGCTLGEPGIPAATASIGATNYSAGFDGVSGYVDVPVGNLNITGPMTVIAWIQTPSVGEAGSHFGTVLGHSDQSYRISVVGNPPRFADDGPDAVGTVNVGDGSWHQIVGVYDGTNQYIYSDGQLTGTNGPSVPSGSGDDVWIAGAPDYAGQRNFTGNIAEVAILTNALTASQVSAAYSALNLLPVLETDVIPLTIVPAGVPVTLSVSIIGTPPFYYQWSNGVSAIPGATNSSVTFNALAGTNTYIVAISNAYGLTNSSIATVVGLTNPPPVVDFETNGQDWSLNYGANVYPYINNNVLTLTDGNLSEASSAFFDTVQYIGGFFASFTYTETTASGGTPADGITFCMQNSTAGVTAVGSGGGDIGYTGILPSAALCINIYPYGSGGVGIQLGTNGTAPDAGSPYTSPPSISTLPVGITNGDPTYVQLYYVQNVMNVAMVDTLTGASFTGSLPLTNLPAIVGGSSAYIGFTGGTGGASAAQTVSNFVFSYTTPPTLSLTSAPAGAVVVSWPVSVSTLFSLQQSTNLTGAWSNVNVTPQIVNSNNEVTLTPGTSTAFYRLLIP